MSTSGRPIHSAWVRRRRNRRAAEGWSPTLWRWLGILGAVALLVPFVDELFLGWLSAPPDLWGEPMQGLLLRADIVVVGWIAIDTYSVLVRGGDRSVLAHWPVDPAEVVSFEMARLARTSIGLVPAGMVLLLPLAQMAPGWWALTGLHLLAAWVLALSSSALVVLLAISMSDSPSVRPWLDLVRGNNHPAQAAFLYAPAVVLLAVGVLLQVSASPFLFPDWPAAAHVGTGLLPFGVAALAWRPVPGLARRNWFRAGQVMAEVDARYALVEDTDEAGRVYLDWTVRWLPRRLQRYALLDLRQGWRTRRSFVMGAWLGALASGVAAWTADPAGPGRSVALASLGIWAVASLALVMERAEPPFLRAWLPAAPLERALARGAVVVLWLQPLVWTGTLASAIRQGPVAGLAVFGVTLGCAVLAAGIAVTTARRGGLPVYLPLAALCSALLAIGALR